MATEPASADSFHSRLGIDHSFSCHFVLGRRATRSSAGARKPPESSNAHERIGIVLEGAAIGIASAAGWLPNPYGPILATAAAASAIGALLRRHRLSRKRSI